MVDMSLCSLFSQNSDGGSGSSSDPLIARVDEEQYTSCRSLAAFLYFITDWPYQIVSDISKQKQPQGSGCCCSSTARLLTDTESEEDGANDETQVTLRQWILFLLGSLFWSLLVLVGFIFQLMTCFRRDRINTNLTPIQNSNHTKELSCNDRSEVVCGLLIPNTVVVLLAVWVYFTLKLGDQCNDWCRCCGWKELSSVVKADSEQYLKNLVAIVRSTEKLGKSTIVCYILISFFYVFLSLGVSAVYSVVFHLTDTNVIIQPPINLFHEDDDKGKLDGAKKYIFIVAAIIGFFGFDILYIRVIMRYACRCQMIIYILQYMKDNITTFTDLDVSKQKDLRNFVKYLNVSSGTVGFVIIIAAYQAANCCVILFSDDITYLQAVAVALRLILWGFLAVFPFHKAAGVNIASKKLHDTGWNMHRPSLNNQIRPSLDIQSSSNNETCIILKARIFGITVNPWLPYVVIILLLLTIMIGSKFKWYDHVL